MRLEAFGGATLDLAFELFTSIEITTSLSEPASATLEIGDVRTWNELDSLLLPGSEWSVFLNDRPVLQGRLEVRDGPINAQSGATVRAVIRTRLADAQQASAEPKLSVKDVTIRQLVLAAYEPLGFVERDFDFSGAASRQLLTGRLGDAEPPNGIEALSAEDAKVGPPETIFDFVSRHLERHGLIHWDGPDGKIVVAKPDDNQAPTYSFRVLQGAAAAYNNVLSLSPTLDYSSAAGVVGVFGGAGVNYARSKISAYAEDADVVAAGFYRPVLALDEGVKSQSIAQRRADQELRSRNRGKRALGVEVDGLSFRDGSARTPYAINTTADVLAETLGGALGSYLVERVTLRRDPTRGDTARLELAAQGAWA